MTPTLESTRDSILSTLNSLPETRVLWTNPTDNPKFLFATKDNVVGSSPAARWVFAEVKHLITVVREPDLKGAFAYRYWELVPEAPPRFVCQLSTEEIRNLAMQYVKESGDDSEVMAAGTAIREGSYSRENLMTIVEWKLGRPNGTYFPSIRYIKENTDEAIASSLRAAVHAKTEREAIEACMRLQGVQVRVASAIMMAIYPKRYTVIDVRSLEELGQSNDRPSVAYYLQYREACEQIAEARGVELRDLDRALWQKNRKPYEHIAAPGRSSETRAKGRDTTVERRAIQAENFRVSVLKLESVLRKHIPQGVRRDRRTLGQLIFDARQTGKFSEARLAELNFINKIRIALYHPGPDEVPDEDLARATDSARALAKRYE